LVLAHLFVKVPRPGEVMESFWSSSQAATVFILSITQRYRHSIMPLSALPKDTRKLANLIFTLSIFNAEHQTGKQQIPTFKVFWLNLLSKSSTGLLTLRWML